MRRVNNGLPGFSSPLSYVFWRMRLSVRKKWQIQVRSGNCVCPVMMDDCKCGKTIIHCPGFSSPLSYYNCACAKNLLTEGPFAGDKGVTTTQ